MAGIKALRKIQIGKETTAGTAVAATTIWRGMGTLSDDRELVFVDEDVGSYMSPGRVYIPKKEASIALDEVEATFEQAPYIFAMSIENITSGVVDAGTGATGYIYQYDVPTGSTANTIQTYTFEGGDNQRVDEVEYCHVTDWTLSGAPGEAIKLSANVRGRQATDAEFTGALSVPTVEHALFQKGKLYIDATGGTIGTTQVANVWKGFTVNYPSAIKANYTGDGNLYFTATVFTGHNEAPITGEIVLDHGTVAEAEIGFARAGTTRLVRFLIEGDALTTAGDTYTYKTLQVDAAIKYTEVPDIGDADGDSILTFPFRVVNSSSDSLGMQIIVVNELSALT